MSTFADLPHELVDEIVTLASTDSLASARSLMLVCKHFLRTGRRAAYRSICAATMARAESLAATLQMNPDLGSLVHSLTLADDAVVSWTLRLDGRDELEQLLAACTGLRHLTLSCPKDARTHPLVYDEILGRRASAIDPLLYPPPRKAYGARAEGRGRGADGGDAGSRHRHIWGSQLESLVIFEPILNMKISHFVGWTPSLRRIAFAAPRADKWHILGRQPLISESGLGAIDLALTALKGVIRLSLPPRGHQELHTTPARSVGTVESGRSVVLVFFVEDDLRYLSGQFDGLYGLAAECSVDFRVVVVGNREEMFRRLDDSSLWSLPDAGQSER